jgi:uncharacterized protein YoxC
MRVVARFFVSLWLALTCLSLVAAETEENAAEPGVQLSIAVEVKGLEPALMEVSTSMKRLADSLEQVATHPDLNPERQKEMLETLKGIEQISAEFQKMLTGVPATVERTGEPLLLAFERFSGEVKQWVILIGVTLLLVVAIGFTLCYFLMIAPAARAMVETSRQVASLSDNLSETSVLVREVAELNRETSLLLEKQRPIQNS